MLIGSNPNIVDAGKSFLEGLNAPAADPTQAAPVTTETPAQTTETPPVETPAADPVPATVAGAPETTTAPVAPGVPQLDTSALDAMRDSILQGIQSLRDGGATDGTEDLGSEGEPGTDPTQTEPLMSDDEFMEKFAENPVQTVKDLADSIANKEVASQMSDFVEKMQPFIQESEKIAFQKTVKDTLAEFISNDEYADADKYFPEMAKIIKEQGLPQDDVNTYANTYKDVALRDLRANQSAPKTTEDIMSDPNEVSKIVADPKIQEAVIKEYLQKIAGGGNPQVITNNGSAAPAATPATRPQSIAEAGKMFKSQLQ